MRNDQTSTWRMIALTAFATAVCWVASVAMLRAIAQTSDPVVETNEAEPTERRGPAPKLRDEESPEFRDSADNNISFPIDI